MTIWGPGGGRGGTDHETAALSTWAAAQCATRSQQLLQNTSVELDLLVRAGRDPWTRPREREGCTLYPASLPCRPLILSSSRSLVQPWDTKYIHVPVRVSNPFFLLFFPLFFFSCFPFFHFLTLNLRSSSVPPSALWMSTTPRVQPAARTRSSGCGGGGGFGKEKKGDSDRNGRE